MKIKTWSNHIHYSILDLLDSSAGRYTDSTIDRCSQLVGPLGQALDKIYDENLVEKEVYRHRRRHVTRDENVNLFVQLLARDQLFKNTPGRAHKAFPNFVHSETPKKACKYLPKMRYLSKRLDKRRRNVLNE